MQIEIRYFSGNEFEKLNENISIEGKITTQYFFLLNKTQSVYFFHHTRKIKKYFILSS